MSSSLALKIVKFKDESFYECQYTGAKRKQRYAIPQAGKDRKGTFADPACAVAWLLDNSDSADPPGKIKDEKVRKLLRAVAEDLKIGSVSEQPLTRAPRIDPGENIDWSYQTKYHWMMHPRSGYTPIEHDATKTKASVEKSSSSSSSSSPSNKKSYLYTIDPESQGGKSLCVSFEFKKSVTFEEALTIRRIGFNSYKSKDCIILSEDGENDAPNPQLDSMFGSDMKCKGTAYILMRKPLHDDGCKGGGGEEVAESGGVQEVTIETKHHSHSSSSSSSSSSSKSAEPKGKKQRDRMIDSTIDSLIISNTEMGSHPTNEKKRARKETTQ